ncbi:hypothetical protein CDEST_01178 [Colletotrichum destructivum]|uniref:Uncharacterized protein n=1 Tax=Colletotrichum destructivum TaxID=34406 RepID=A0AAX4HZL3_9PEZI|nr:hypothetical protein CDEST_01178 [Colletotrichum destructivum]
MLLRHTNILSRSQQITRTILRAHRRIRGPTRKCRSDRGACSHNFQREMDS